MNDPTHMAAADQQVLITRIFEAPREQVFKAWTDPDQELGTAIALNHGELVAPADAQVDVDPLAWGVVVLGAVPRRPRSAMRSSSSWSRS